MTILLGKCIRRTSKASFFNYDGIFQGERVYGVLLKNKGIHFKVGCDYLVHFKDCKMRGIIIEGVAVRGKEL